MIILRKLPKLLFIYILGTLFPFCSIIAQGSTGYEVTRINSFPQNVGGMTIDESGVLYFSDTYEHLDDISKVYMLNPPYTGKPVPTKITGHSLTGLMWHDNRLYVAFLNDDEIIVYDNNLEFLEAIPADSPLGFTTDGTTIYIFTYYGEIGVLSNNRVRYFLKDVQSPTCIKYSGKNSMFIAHKANNGNEAIISEIGSEGEILDTLAKEVKEPYGIELDSEGNLLFTDKAAGKIFLKTRGEPQQMISDAFSSPLLIAKIPSDGFLINSNHDNGVLLHLTRTR